MTTTSAKEHDDLRPAAGATLIVKSQRGEQVFALTSDEITLGRSPESDIHVDEEVISRSHARLVRDGGSYRFVQLGRKNGTYLRGSPVTDLLLTHGDRLEVAAGDERAVEMLFQLDNATLADTLELTRAFSLREVRPAKGGGGRLPLPASGSVSIGRSQASDLVLDSLSVSRSHARIDTRDGVARIIDLESANGTYVNGMTTQTRTLIAGDIVRIGPFKLVYRDNVIEHQDDSRAVRLDVHGVTKVVSGKVLLSEVSLSAYPGEVLAIAGTSGAGKSTLIYALNGLRPPTSGHILVNGADLYRAYDSVRPLIGYVPQQTILPEYLTVRRALQYVARLRLPPDVSGADADARVEEVMRSLDLQERADVRIVRLSGGQQKRASIAAELIANPGLFFLDEPTTGLDPALTRHVTGIIRELAASGSTVIMVSHDVESLQAADRIVFLAAGGHVVFIGTPAEAKSYFGVDDFAAIYEQVEAADAVELERRLHASAHYRKQVAPGLLQAAALEGEVPPALTLDPVAMIGAGVRRGASAWRQFRIVTRRYVESMLGDRGHLTILLAQAPIIAILLALVTHRGDFGPPDPDIVAKATGFGVPAAGATLAKPLAVFLAVSATWFGAFAAAQEIVKELPILRRERLAGLRVAPYLASKFVVLALLCSLQTALLLAIIAVRADLPSSGILLPAPLELWITLELAAIAALGLGLVISTVASNQDQAAGLVPIVLIPQLIFVGRATDSGASRWISYLMVTHWSSIGMKVTAHIPYTRTGGNFDAAALLINWAALAIMAAVFVLFAGWRLARQRA
ncbi:MAG: FHA domain-containing protein [Chloroflexota bacterium]|nr:FHA domain-containing protein [Chloroflexota bacterium]